MAQNKAIPIKPIDTQRVKEIELLLVDKPAGYGDPCNRRDVWDKLLNSGAYDKFLKETESFSFPKFSKEDYFSLSDGSAPSSARGLEMMRDRAKGLSRFTWAECLENKDRYTQKVADGLRELLNQSSWVSPRSDIDFKNYKDMSYTVELTSALYAHTIAQTLYLMGNKIDPKLRQDAMDALYLKIFNPVINSIQTKNTEESKFLVMTNNWNHVCLSGVVGAALTVIEDKTERAIFSWIGEYYSQNGLVSFEDDGYCSEGIGYFNYGIGHFIMLRENIWQATNGRVDLLSDDKIKKIALYVPNIEIINGIYPPFSDSSFKNKPDSSIVSYLSRNLSVGLLEYDTLTFIGKTTDIRNNIMMAFPNSASLAKPNKSDQNRVDNLRSFFAQSGVLVSRPMPNSPCRMGVAMKGGHNDENHNHNDLGSYSVVLGREMMAGDPGRIPYTSDIFNNKYRYTYKSIGSMGHPVPLVASQEQQYGREAKGIILNTKFTEMQDEIELDITSAYNVQDLKQVRRMFTYSREGEGKLMVVDDFKFSTPQNFETAIITRSRWSEQSNNTLLLERGDEKMLVTISSPNSGFSIKSEQISEGGEPYTRIGIYLNQPMLSGRVSVSYTLHE